MNRQRKQKAEELAALEREQRYRMVGYIEYDFTESTDPIQTKSITNAQRAKVTHEYCIGNDGYEVKHDKYSVAMNFNNHKYWTGLDSFSRVYLDGVETLTYYYRNRIIHGKLAYSRDTRTTPTIYNRMKIIDLYNNDICKGFLTGNFKFK